MISDDLKLFVEKESKRLDALYGSLDERTRALARAAKLTEEVGELNDAVLSYLEFQRPDKLKGFSKKNLEDEFADALLCVLLLAESTDVDVSRVLRSKIDEIQKRNY